MRESIDNPAVVKRLDCPLLRQKFTVVMNTRYSLLRAIFFYVFRAVQASCTRCSRLSDTIHTYIEFLFRLFLSALLRFVAPLSLKLFATFVSLNSPTPDRRSAETIRVTRIPSTSRSTSGL